MIVTPFRGRRIDGHAANGIFCRRLRGLDLPLNQAAGTRAQAGYRPRWRTRPHAEAADYASRICYPWGTVAAIDPVIRALAN